MATAAPPSAIADDYERLIPAVTTASDIGDYVLGDVLGEGTFGKVRRGTHRPTGAAVAVKILERRRMTTDDDAVRVSREIALLSAVDHPNVVRLFDVIKTAGVIYLIMEFCPRGPLFDYIVSKGRVSEREACRVLHCVLNGVAHCHAADVVHRDLKPENVLLTDDPAVGLKIVDFGLGNRCGSAASPDGLLKTACGSPCYAAPEMLEGKRYRGPLADMWSLGVILYALLCGFLPFEHPNTNKLYAKIKAGRYEVPSFVSAGARDLISRLLTTDPARRYTPAHVRAHPWYRGLAVPTDPPVPGAQPLPPAAAAALGGDPWAAVDGGLVADMIAGGYRRADIVDALATRTRNHVTATYFCSVLASLKLLLHSFRCPSLAAWLCRCQRLSRCSHNRLRLHLCRPQCQRRLRTRRQLTHQPLCMLQPQPLRLRQRQPQYRPT